MPRYQSLVCDDDERRQAVIEHPNLNGIAAVETSAASLDAQRFLRVFFLKPDFLDDLVGKPHLVEVVGGTRIAGIRPLDVTRDGDTLLIEVDRPGDFSTYTLTLRVAWIDPAFNHRQFSFKAGCPSDFDCRHEEVCLEEPGPAPLIDYMAKDYASFRQALLDLIPILTPEWSERNPSDLGIALLELLAYAGDQLSYYQDAVANEAYLATARQRISVRRHARLIDYPMHDGASARAFIELRAASPGVIPAATPVLSRISQPIDGSAAGAVIPALRRVEAYAAADVIFETVEQAFVHHALSEIELYAWGNRQCCLPRGAVELDLAGNLTPWFSAGHLAGAGSLAALLRDATDAVSAYIAGRLPAPVQALLAAYADGDPVDGDLIAGLLAGLNACLEDRALWTSSRFAGVPIKQALHDLLARNVVGGELIRRNRWLLEAAYPAQIAASPMLQPGAWLLFEEIRSPVTGLQADADRLHRQVVRLVSAAPTQDPLLGQELTHVVWGAADALGFPLCLSARLADGRYEDVISVARGNLLLADHGQTISGEEHSGPVAPPSERQRRAFRLMLNEGPLSMRVPRPPDNGVLAPAAHLLRADPQLAQPQVLALQVTNHGLSSAWRRLSHLLNSEAMDQVFAVETDNRGRSLLRFGDNRYGMAPPDGAGIRADYRVGVGTAGNVGAESLAHLVDLNAGDDWPEIAADGVRNPLAAWGGIDPEPIEQVKLHAPAAMKAEQRRAVTEADYARAAEMHPEVAKAVATFRWTGSWHTVFITVDPVGRTDLPPDMQERIHAWVTRFTQAGYDLEIDPPTFTPLEIELKICAAADHFRGHVKEAVLLALSNRVLPNGQRGFFHPDNFTFGQRLYLSQLYAAVEAVEGVDSAEVTVFQRFGQAPNKELEKGYIGGGRLEVVRLDNDPNFQENGVLRLTMLGGK